MFAYVLRAPGAPNDEQSQEFFRRFAEQPGLAHAYELEGDEDASDSFLVAVWEDRESAERYLKSAPLRKDVDNTYGNVTRTMYKVISSK